ncbi:hypothetical protein HY641_04355 [Candidatus Woesearchaeota archaeon]|nr:hypothetical protein [Candidatus Woesearchaeota archaeon]
MADPWKDESRSHHASKVPRFHLQVINFLLIVIVILIGLYLYKSYVYNKLRADTTDVQEKLDAKDAEMQSLVLEVSKQKEVLAREQQKVPGLLAEINKFNVSLSQLNKSMAAFEEGQRAVKYACISSLECRDIYLNLSINIFLTQKSFSTQLVNVEKGLDYNQLFLSPVETTNLTFVQRDFIKGNCLNKWYEIPGLAVSRYTFRLTTDVNKLIQIIMNEKSADILCAWMLDEPSKAHTLVA